MSTQAVILDMDGLLIDTEPVWRRVEVEVFGTVGLHLTEEQCLETMGVPVIDVVRLWHSRHPWKSPTIAEVADRIVRGVIDHVHREGEPMPGVISAVRQIHNARLPIAVASSSTTETIRAVLDRLQIAQYVRAVASAEDEVAGKPDPGVFLSAARKLGVAPTNCVAIEDSPNGVLSAKRAGMYCIVVPDPHFRDDPRMDEADLLLQTLEGFSLDHLPGVSRFTSRQEAMIGRDVSTREEA